MKNVKLIILAISVASFSGSVAQNQNADNANAAQQTSAADSTSGNVPKTDEVAGAGRSNGLANSGAAEPGSISPGPSNTAAVPQTTSSQGGSPAILSDNNGKDRDGTNNVQRASMNMAGSPVRNVRVQAGADPDTEIEQSQRQRESRQQNVSKQSERTGNADTLSGQASRDRSNNMDDKNRRENNAASDQSLDSKDESATNQQNQKSRRKQKRKG